VSTKRLATKFKNAVARTWSTWSTAREGYEVPVDKDMLAYKTYSSIVGHGVGLWDGEVLSEAEGRAFEQVVKRDSILVNLGHELDYEIMLDTERKPNPARRRYRNNTADATTVKEAKQRALTVLSQVESFLDYLGEGEVEQVWLIGSRAKGTPTSTSDWDFLVVGPGLDDAEEERLRLAEEGRPFSRALGIKVFSRDNLTMRGFHSDVILSETGPKPGQAAILVWPSE
ncbi:MAG: nucleotidyltransferase domain-containing protein, partial [Gammaproteobacteria bacterium]|nr:nucleotidyltransferase domain-containing protein [Gammaproteobacteria bacterium]